MWQHNQHWISFHLFNKYLFYSSFWSSPLSLRNKCPASPPTTTTTRRSRPLCKTILAPSIPPASTLSPWATRPATTTPSCPEASRRPPTGPASAYVFIMIHSHSFPPLISPLPALETKRAPVCEPDLPGDHHSFFQEIQQSQGLEAQQEPSYWVHYRYGCSAVSSPSRLHQGPRGPSQPKQLKGHLPDSAAEHLPGQPDQASPESPEYLLVLGGDLLGSQSRPTFLPPPPPPPPAMDPYDTICFLQLRSAAVIPPAVTTKAENPPPSFSGENPVAHPVYASYNNKKMNYGQYVLPAIIYS